MWAGEACAIEGHQCVHGAFISGEEAADKVIEELCKIESHRASLKQASD
jgi:hypothetical protein